MKALLLGLALLGLLTQTPIATAADWEYRCHGSVTRTADNTWPIGAEMVVKFWYFKNGQQHTHYSTVQTDFLGLFDARVTISGWNGPVQMKCISISGEIIESGDQSGCEGGMTLFDRTGILSVKTRPQ